VTEWSNAPFHQRLQQLDVPDAVLSLGTVLLTLVVATIVGDLLTRAASSPRH
jgi:hypothetical protein